MTMRMDSNDPWLSPTRQREYPLREMLADEQLHARREGWFLALATLFLATIATMIELGAGRMIEVQDILVSISPALELPTRLQVPVGALAFPLSVFAIALVRELYGRRRANALIMAGLLAMVGWAALRYATSADPAVVLRWAPAFACAYVVTHVVHAVSFGAMMDTGRDRRWIRRTLALALAQLCGWAAFGLVSYRYATVVLGHAEPAATAQAITVGVDAAAYTIAFGLIDLIPFLVLASFLEVYLRVGGGQREDDWDEDGALAEPVELRPRLPAAMVIEDREPAVQRSRRTTLQPFNSTELRFFTEGDELTEAVEAR